MYTPTMQSARVLDLFRQCGALLEGHFQLSSGLHTAGYLQCALVLQHPTHAETLGAALSARVADHDAAAVLSPALGGLIIGHEVARAAGVRALFAERRDGALTLRRGFSLDPGERVLVVEDVVTSQPTAGSLADNRGGPDVGFDVPFAALAEVSWPTYDPAECPLCADGTPLTKPGSRR